MEIKFNGKDKELRYSFNSFKHMRDFRISDLDELEDYPFRMMEVAEILLLGALNHDPKDAITELEVSEHLNNVMEDGKLIDLMDELMLLLEDSSFFKNLQGK